MTTKSIHLANDLDLPFTITTYKTSLMGGNGSGKTYAMMKMIEEILSANGWVIVLDPVGVHYGIRLDKTGKKPSGFDIPIFGGLHGDVNLTPTSGKLIADLLCDRRLSAILDVSQFESDADLNRFAIDFGNQFWIRMKQQRRAVTLVLEECQEFIPQNPQKGEEKKLHIYNRIAKIGRNYGIGVMMASARPQDINKKSLNLTQLMFAFQMTGTHERKAMAEWFSYAGIESDLGNLLPTLEVGQPYVMSPRTLKINKQVKILPKKTFDASATPDFDDTDSETIKLNPIDISKLEDAMSKQIAEAKANDPKELQKEIARLKREIENVKSLQPEHDRVEIRVPVFDEAFHKSISDSLKKFDDKAEAIRQEVKAFSDKANADIVNLISALVEPSRALEEIRASVNGHKQKKVEYKTQPSIPVRISITPKVTKSVDGDTDSKPLAEGENKLLTLCAQYPDGVTKNQLIVLSGYKSRTVNAYLQKLSGRGFVGVQGSTVHCQQAGYDHLGSDFEPLPTGHALWVYWMGRLPAGETRILDCVSRAYPESVSKDSIKEATGYEPRTINAYLQKMQSRRLVTVSGQAVTASAELF